MIHDALTIGGRNRMLRIGYIGSTTTPEFDTLVSRKNARIVSIASSNANVQSDDDVLHFDSPGDLIRDSEIDAVILALPPREQIDIARIAANKKLPILIVPPIAESADAAAAAIDDLDSVVTCVSRPMRLAVNLVQIRRTVKRFGSEWIRGRYVGSSSGGRSLVSQAEGIIDLLRFVGGGISTVDAVASSAPELVSFAFTFESGTRGMLRLVDGWTNGTEYAIDAMTDGRRYRWSNEWNSITIDGKENRASDSKQGQYVAAVAGFLTAVEHNTHSPIVSDFRDAVETMRVVERFEAVLRK